VKVWIDTDPGIDDALAIMLALKSPELEVVGISAVHGNIDVELGASNALKILSLLGSNVPVWVGASRNLIGDLRTAPYIHGEDGLGDLLTAPDRRPESGSASDALARALKEAEEPITVIALGPLTNVALALAREPGIDRNVERIVIMGGAFRCEGNTTPAAEFNVYCDPEAAYRVLHSGIPQVWVGLDVTMRTVMPLEWSEELADRKDKKLRFIGELTRFYSKYYRSYYGIQGCALHDPLTVGYLLDPELLTTREVFVDVELGGALCRGRTVADLWGIPEPWGKPNAKVALDVEAGAFLRLFRERVLQEEDRA
jgi:purine nucleosidase